MKYEIIDNGASDISPIEENETDKNANGGTELMKRALYERLDKDLYSNFQIIPSRVRKLYDDKLKVYWLHDLPNDPESQHLKDGGWQKFDQLVFVSHWQQVQYHGVLGVPFEAGTVLRNAIVPFHPEKLEKGDPTKELRIIYHTTPHRGLNLLYPVFNKLSEEHDNIVLDVFSSFNAYGWPQRDEPFKELFGLLDKHPKINYHGFQPNHVVREYLEKAHIFAYPSIWPETSCIALMEAMSAGCLCVHSSYAALPETAANWTYMYQYAENPQLHVNRFYQALKEGISLCSDVESYKLMQSRLQMQKNYADAFYSWDVRQHEWTGLLTSLLNTKGSNEKKETADRETEAGTN